MVKVNVGDHVKVTLKNNQRFEGVVFKSYDGGFACKILEKDNRVGVASWKEYSLDKDARFQIYSDCKKVNVLHEAKTLKSELTFKINESAREEKAITFFTTEIGNGKYFIFTENKKGGGWTISDNVKSESLLESYIKSVK